MCRSRWRRGGIHSARDPVERTCQDRKPGNSTSGPIGQMAESLQPVILPLPTASECHQCARCRDAEPRRDGRHERHAGARRVLPGADVCTGPCWKRLGDDGGKCSRGVTDAVPGSRRTLWRVDRIAVLHGRDAEHVHTAAAVPRDSRCASLTTVHARAAHVPEMPDTARRVVRGAEHRLRTLGTRDLLRRKITLKGYSRSAVKSTCCGVHVAGI